jgi:hypothetical protein
MLVVDVFGDDVALLAQPGFVVSIILAKRHLFPCGSIEREIALASIGAILPQDVSS